LRSGPSARLEPSRSPVCPSFGAQRTVRGQ